MDSSLVNAMLTPANMLWVGAGLQIACMLVGWSLAEMRVMAASLDPAMQLPLRAPVALRRNAARAAIVQMRGPGPARCRDIGSAMIERDAA